MESNSSPPKKKRTRLLLISIFVIISVITFACYNFNRLLTTALLSSFKSNIVSDVYDLKFKKLRVDLFRGNISVYEVTLIPLEKPLYEYHYINSSFSLTAERLELQDVEILTLLISKKLIVENITIQKPDFEVKLAGSVHLFVPFKDSTNATNSSKTRHTSSLNQIVLNEFQLTDASFHTFNLDKKQEFKINGFNILLKQLKISQGLEENSFSFDNVDLLIRKFSGHLKKGPVQHISLNDFEIRIDSLQYQKTLDTLQYQFKDFKAGLNALDVQTADSLFHFTLQSIKLSYEDKSLKLTDLAFKPNVSKDVLDRKYKFQHTQLSGGFGILNLEKIDFDSLLYKQKVIIDKVFLDKVVASIYKDNTKPIDRNRLPAYLGQTIKAIPIPIFIKRVEVTHVDLVNVERKPDSTYATATIKRATVQIKNINNHKSTEKLELMADGFLENKVHFNATVRFDYRKPEFTYEGKLKEFNLPDLNPLIEAYTPAKINKGICDELSFSGLIENTKSSGTMKFLYHDLDIQLNLQHKAKWKSAVISFAANTYLTSSNPRSSKVPPRIVTFHVQRNMNKGFVNILIKSLLQGLKETMIPSKENKKAYKEAKKKSKQ